MVSACSDAALVVSVGPGLDLRVGDNLDSRNDPPNKERSTGQVLTAPAGGTIIRINMKPGTSFQQEKHKQLSLQYNDLQLMIYK